MDHSHSVTWERRLFLAGASMVFTIILTTTMLTIRDTVRTPDTDWHSMGGNIQLVLFYLFVQGIVGAATFPFFIMPLVLFLSSTVQLKYWYGVIAVSLLWLPAAMLCLQFIGVKSLRGIGGRDWLLTYLFVDLPALVSCCLYLLLLRSVQRRSRDVPVAMAR